jgi:hypothetical protein
MMNSIGKKPELGSAPGKNTGARMPVMLFSLPFTSCWIGKMLRSRSSHGFTTRPPNPPLGNVIWNE